jgi:hypothetical protein
MNNRNQNQRSSSDGRAVRASMHSPGTANQRHDFDSPSGRDASVATSSSNAAPTQLSTIPAATATYMNVFTVEEYERDGKTQKRWTKIGAAFPHKEGMGFSIELKAFPIDGRLVILPPDNDDIRSK